MQHKENNKHWVVLVKSSLLAFVIIAIMFSIIGCSEDSGTGSGNGVKLGPGIGMVAVVDGNNWAAPTGGCFAWKANDIYGLGGIDVTSSLTIGLFFNGSGVGDYDISSKVLNNNAVVGPIGNDYGWSAGDSQGSGVISVATLTETRIAGTFSFTAIADSIGLTPTTRVVKNGAFDLEFDPIE